MRNLRKEKFDRELGVAAVLIVAAFLAFMQYETMQNGLRGSIDDDTGDCRVAYYCPGR